jgi:hypothetical protein
LAHHCNERGRNNYLYPRLSNFVNRREPVFQFSCTAERFAEDHLRRSAGMFVVKQRVGGADEVIE